MVADFLSWALVMAMPGPDIISIGLQTSRYGLRAGFWTALGAALGVAVWSVLSLVGIEALLVAVPTLRVVLPMVGCVVLVILGVLALRDAARPASNHSDQVVTESIPSARSLETGTWAKSLRLGFVTNISNAKGIGFLYLFLYSNDEPLRWIQPEIPGSRPSASGDSAGIPRDVRAVESSSEFASGPNSRCSFRAWHSLHFYWCLLYLRTCLSNKKEKLCVFFMSVLISQTLRLF